MTEYIATSDDTYYTRDHEWIQYKGALAITGVSGFKLTGIKEVHKFVIYEPLGLKKQGEKIAAIHYNDYRIEVFMPVSGLILEINGELIKGNPGIIVQEPESRGWVACIKPLRSEERDRLLLPEVYMQKIGSKMFQ